MKGDRIPDSDHISRYCGASSIESDGTVNGTAFRIREGEEYLSVNWLEFLGKSSRDEEIAEIQNILRKKLRLGSRSKIAVAEVGTLINHVQEERRLRIEHEPELPDDPSHSGIYGYAIEDDLIADIIAEVFQETYPAKLAQS